MTTKPHAIRPLRVALVAALSFGATAALAQASDPLSAPVPQTPPIAAPAEPVAAPVVVPSVAPSAATPTTPRVTSTPVVQPIPVETDETLAAETSPAPAEPATALAPAREAAPREAPRAAVPAPVAAELQIDDAQTASTATETLSSPVMEPVVVPTAADTRPANDNTIAMIAAIVGTLCILALAIWGFVAVGRRKAPYERAKVPTIERPKVAERAPEPMPKPMATRPVSPVEPVLAIAPSRPMTAGGTHGGLPHAGASVALPRTLPESFEERDALLKRMIAAKPDRANPFTNRSARTKRARLILQSLGRDFGDAQPWIDLSQYPNNWPELARHKSAAA
jgi:hypothetical protein